MFKDYDKYLSKSLKVYLFVLVCVFIMKIVGLDYFGLDIDNPILLKINSFCIKYHLVYVWQTITLYLYVYIISSISCKKKNIKEMIACFLPFSYMRKQIHHKRNKCLMKHYKEV